MGVDGLLSAFHTPLHRLDDSIIPIAKTRSCTSRKTRIVLASVHPEDTSPKRPQRHPLTTFLARRALFVHKIVLKLFEHMDNICAYLYVCKIYSWMVSICTCCENVWCMYISINTPSPYAERYS